MGRGALHCNNVKRFGANTVKSSAIGSVQWAGGHCIATMLKDLVKSFTIVLLHCKCCEKQCNRQCAMGRGALPAHELGRKWPLGGHTTQHRRPKLRPKYEERKYIELEVSGPQLLLGCALRSIWPLRPCDPCIFGVK